MLITRRRAGAGPRPRARTRSAPFPWTAPGRAPTQSPGGRAQRLIANPLGSGSHGLGHLPPRGCSRAPQLARRRLASSPRPPPAKLPGQRGGEWGRLRSRLSRRDHNESLLPASAWHPFFFSFFVGVGGEKGWKDADVEKGRSPSTPSGLCSNKEGVGSKSGCTSLPALSRTCWGGARGVPPITLAGEVYCRGGIQGPELPLQGSIWTDSPSPNLSHVFAWSSR